MFCSVLFSPWQVHIFLHTISLSSSSSSPSKVLVILLLIIILTMASLRSGPIAPGIAFVTGGARGLGNAIAVSFAREGSKGIALVDIQDEKTFEQGKAAVTKYGTKVGCNQQLMCFHPLADHDDQPFMMIMI